MKLTKEKIRLQMFNNLFKLPDLHTFQNESERIYLIEKLAINNHNIQRTAKSLKITRSHLYNLLEKYDIKRL